MRHKHSYYMHWASVSPVVQQVEQIAGEWGRLALTGRGGG